MVDPESVSSRSNMSVLPHQGVIDPRKCSVGKGGSPCDICSRMTALEVESQRAYDLWQSLEVQKSLIVHRLYNPLHDPLTCHLPIELISRIFTFVVDDFEDPFRDGYQSNFSKIECSAPLVISAVCRSWREIAFGTPGLWKTANLYIYSIEKVDLQEYLVEEWFSRSGQLPLQISLFSAESENMAFQDPDLATGLFNTIKTYATRWRSLNLILPSYWYPQFFENLGVAPSLKSIQLRSNTSSYHYGMIPLPNLPALENARFWELNLYEITHMHWTNLTTFYMRSVSADEIIKIFQLASRLEQCVFTGIKYLGDDDDPQYALPTAPVVHSSLKDLELEILDGNTFWMDVRVLPSLERFVCTEFPDPEFFQPPFAAYDALVSFFRCSQCKIQTFGLRGPELYIADDQLIQILESMPSIKRLELVRFGRNSGDTWITDQFFERFHSSSEPLTPEIAFLPCLSDLEIHYNGTFPWKSFSDALDSLSSQIKVTEHACNMEILPDNETVKMQRRHINICVKLLYQTVDDYLDHRDSHFSPHLKTTDWEESISLKVHSGLDLIQAACGLWEEVDEEVSNSP